jgi:hypothetical protein
MSRNFERALLLLVGVLAAAVGAVLLRSHLPVARSIASLEDQKRCADQAQIFFRQVQHDNDNWPGAELVQNRYDPTSGVCFVRVSSDTISSRSTNGPVTQFRDEVVDAFTGRDYAEALIYQHENSETTNTAFCYVLDGSREPKSCKTENEYLHLIDRYLP